LFFLIIINCVSVRVSEVVEDVVATGSGASSSVCKAIKLLCLAGVGFEVGFGAKSVVDVVASVLVCDIVSLSLRVGDVGDVGEAMFCFLLVSVVNVEE
jgi:hypothetical protein